MRREPIGWVNPENPVHHGKPLWAVYGCESFPSVLCCKLLSYTASHALLPPGSVGHYTVIWGYSVYRRVAGFRTLGVNLAGWQKESEYGPWFFDSQDAAFAELRRLTTPKPGHVP